MFGTSGEMQNQSAIAWMPRNLNPKNQSQVGNQHIHFPAEGPNTLASK